MRIRTPSRVPVGPGGGARRHVSPARLAAVVILTAGVMYFISTMQVLPQIERSAESPADTASRHGMCSETLVQHGTCIGLLGDRVSGILVKSLIYFLNPKWNCVHFTALYLRAAFYGMGKHRPRTIRLRPMPDSAARLVRSYTGSPQQRRK